MSLVDDLRLSIPLIQPPMAGVSTPALAAAVSEAGGLGSIAVGATDPAEARAMIEDLRRRTARPFNVNLFVHATPVADQVSETAWLKALAPIFAAFDARPPATLRVIYRSLADNPDMLAVLLDLAPPVVSFHFGLPPSDIIAALRSRGIKLIATATSPAEARAVVAAGLDAVVAQGFEAGGHRGIFDPDAVDDQLGVLALVRLLVREGSLPVVAAGGIMDGAGIAAALDLGAVAAQLGTAFIPCPETAADDGYRAALDGPGADHTAMTSLISGRPARALANRFTALAEQLSGVIPPAYPIAYDAGKALNMVAKAQGDYGFGAQWAGQSAPLSRTMPAADLVRLLAVELAQSRCAAA